jgi:hypothetical protein
VTGRLAGLLTTVNSTRLESVAYKYRTCIFRLFYDEALLIDLLQIVEFILNDSKCSELPLNMYGFLCFTLIFPYFMNSSEYAFDLLT